MSMYIHTYKRTYIQYIFASLREDQPFDPPYHEPCSHADAVFKEYLKFSFEVHGLLSMTTVISIESLIADPIGNTNLHTYIHIYIHTYIHRDL